MSNCIDNVSGFTFEPEVECIMPIHDIFAEPLPFDEARRASIERRYSLEAPDWPNSTFAHQNSFEIFASCSERRRSLEAPASSAERRLSLQAPVSDAASNQLSLDTPASCPGCKCSLMADGVSPRNRPTSTAQEIKNAVQGNALQLEGAPDDSWARDALPITNQENSWWQADHQNYFWNHQNLSTGLERSCSTQATKNFDCDDSRFANADSEHSSVPSVPLSCDFNFTPSQKSNQCTKALTIEVRHAIWDDSATSAPPRRGPNQRCRKNKKALYWTPEDHEKFVAGLKEFGLTRNLGPGGAQMMSTYMGNRTILQIKSHFQKYLSDVRTGKRPSPTPCRVSASDQ